MGRQQRNPVRAAVDAVGGATEASLLLRVSNSAIHQAIERGSMPNVTEEQRARLKLLAEHSGIPVLELAGLDAPATRTSAA